MRNFWLMCCVLLLAGCNLRDDLPAPLMAPGITIPSPTPHLPDPDFPLPAGVYDARPVMAGICFDYAYAQAGRPFVFADAASHIDFYDGVDGSEVCRRAVTRYPFDFVEGHVLIGLWSVGTGCTAQHDMVSFVRDDTAKTITLVLRFVTEGDCPYDLVRPFWVGIPSAAGYGVTLTVAP